MTQKELNKILILHKKWLENDPDGIRANLTDADLTRANLTDANLTDADLTRADLTRANLARANLTRADLTRADLTDANLTRADLTYADLTYADLDFSSLPLWCGSLKADFDDKQLIQIAYHLVKAGLQSDNASKGTKKELNKLVDFANKFHRVLECGKIERI